MRSFKEIVKLIKKLKGLKKDKDVANILNMNYQTFTTCKARNSIPMEKIVMFCQKENLYLDMLLVEKPGTLRVSEGAEAYNKEQDVINELIYKLRQIPAHDFDLIRSIIDIVLIKHRSDTEYTDNKRSGADRRSSDRRVYDSHYKLLQLIPQYISKD